MTDQQHPLRLPRFFLSFSSQLSSSFLLPLLTHSLPVKSTTPSIPASRPPPLLETPPTLHEDDRAVSLDQPNSHVVLQEETALNPQNLPPASAREKAPGRHLSFSAWRPEGGGGKKEVKHPLPLLNRQVPVREKLRFLAYGEKRNSRCCVRTVCVVFLQSFLSVFLFKMENEQQEEELHIARTRPQRPISRRAPSHTRLSTAHASPPPPPSTALFYCCHSYELSNGTKGGLSSLISLSRHRQRADRGKPLFFALCLKNLFFFLLRLLASAP